MSVSRSTTMKSLSVVLIVLSSIVAFAQQTSQLPALNTISVTADGKYEAAPDTAVVTFSFSVQENDSKTAYDHLSRVVDQVRDMFRQNGIDPKQAQVGYFGLQPVRDYKNAKNKIIAYTANTTITLKLKDFAKIPAITAGMSNIEVSSNQSISYDLDNIDEAKSKAVQDALKRAHLEAETVASSSTRTLGELVYASVDTAEQIRAMPMARMSAMAANAAPEPTADFTPQSITVTAHVNVVFSLK
jgi:uncharacterized protein